MVNASSVLWSKFVIHLRLVIRICNVNDILFCIFSKKLIYNKLSFIMNIKGCDFQSLKLTIEHEYIKSRITSLIIFLQNQLLHSRRSKVPTSAWNHQERKNVDSEVWRFPTNLRQLSLPVLNPYIKRFNIKQGRGLL